MYKIELVNKHTKEIIVYDNLEDVNEGEKLFYNFKLNVKDLADGEYALSLYEDGELVATDTLNIGNFSKNAIQYTKGENIYIDSKVNLNVEDRQVEISVVKTTIYPTDGKDAMTSVEVDATNVFNDGFERGYDNGKEDGIVVGENQQKEKLENITITENGTYNREDGYKEIVVNVEDVNGSYDEGYENGVSVGYEQGVNEQKSKLASIEINKNGTYANEDGYNEVNVNVTPLINVKQNQIKFGYSNFMEVPECFDFEGITNATELFSNCQYLRTVPLFDTSGVTSTKKMFTYCRQLPTVPLYDLSNVTDTTDMFNYCKNLTTIPHFNTSKVSVANGMFVDCSVITTIPELDFSSLEDAESMFKGCTKLQSVPLLNFSKVTKINYFFNYSDNKNITDLGGFKGLKIDWNDTYGLYRCPNLTYQSVLNVITNLYNFRENGDTTTTKTLKLHSKSLSLLSSDDIAIATNKGWILIS